MDVDGILQANDEHDILEFLVETGMLEGPSLGIAKQVLTKGRESLKGNQPSVFEKYIVEEYFELECSRCHIPMPSSEVLFALHEGDRLCSWCRKMEQNDD